ncbi:MAG: S8 family serine peptidase, partial [Bacteroidetes bacterium]|nr:S8 family serine peptidase [Bacteroidota bacterium]
MKEVNRLPYRVALKSIGLKGVCSIIIFLCCISGLKAQEIVNFTPGQGSVGDTIDMLIIGSETNFWAEGSNISSVILQNETESIVALNWDSPDIDSAFATFVLTTQECGFYELIVTTPEDGPIHANESFRVLCGRSTDSIALRDLHDDFVTSGHAGLFPVAQTLDNWVPLTEGRVTKLEIPDLLGFGPSNLPNTFSNLDVLDTLDLSNGDIDVVNLEGLISLRSAKLVNNGTGFLSLSGVDELMDLNIDNNSLPDLDLSWSPKLTSLSCVDALTATTIALGDVPLLETLHCFNESFTSLDLTGLVNLRVLDIQNPCIYGGPTCDEPLVPGDLTTLDLAPATALTTVLCGGLSLTSLTGSGANLSYLYASRNQLAELDISGSSDMIKLDVSHNLLETLDLEGFIEMMMLNCDSNSISVLDVTQMAGLDSLFCTGNRLDELIFSVGNGPSMLRCENNQLPFKNLMYFLGLANHDGVSYTIDPQFSSERIFYLDFAVGETFDLAYDDPLSVTLYKWHVDGSPLDDDYYSGGALNLVFTDTTQSGSYYFESLNDSFPGDTLLGPLYVITVNDTTLIPGDDVVPNELILDFTGVSDSLREVFIEILENNEGAYLIDSCVCGGPQLWAVPDSLTDGLETYLDFNSVSDWSKKRLDAEGGSADKNYEWTDHLPSNDDFPYSWSLEYNTYRNADTVVIAVMDQGVDMRHPELSPHRWSPPGMNCSVAYDSTYSGHLFEDSTTIANGLTVPRDDSGHGTGVAGVVSSTVDTSANIRIFNQRVNGVGEEATLFKAICALNMAAVEDIEIINMSLGYWGERSPILENQIRAAGNAGVIIVVSAGNDSTDLSPFVGEDFGFFPANYTRDSFPNLITTSGYNSQKGLADFSNYCDECADVVGPSQNIRTAKYNSSGYDWFSGTSFTAPYVTAVLASIYSGLGSGSSYTEVIDSFFNNYTRDSVIYDGKVKNRRFLDMQSQYLCDVEPIVEDDILIGSVDTVYIDVRLNDCTSDACDRIYTVLGNGSSGSASFPGDSGVLQYVPGDLADVIVADTIEYEITYENCRVPENAFSTGFVIVELENSNVLPVAVCQDITVELDSLGTASITPADIDGCIDVCDFQSLTIDRSDFACTDAGTSIPIELVALDLNGNSSSCTAQVSVEDNESPIAVCQDITVQLDENGTATFSTLLFDNGSTDNCGLDFPDNPVAVDCSHVGSFTMNLFFEDIHGNSNTIEELNGSTTVTCRPTITVEDNVAPEASCQDATVQLDANGVGSTTAEAINNYSTDACGISEISLDATDFDCSDVGDNAVTLMVTDVNSNVSSCEATVTVEGGVPDVTISASEFPDFCQGGTIILTANSPEAVSYFWDTDPGSGGPYITVSANGTYTVTVTSSTGCTGTASYTVTGFDPGALLSTYTILGQNEVHLHGDNVVGSGGVGVIKAGKKAKLHDNTHVLTFVQADRIELNGGSTTASAIYDPANVTLPPFFQNPHNSNNNETVNDGAVVTLTDCFYKKLEIKRNAKVTFTCDNIFIHELKVKEGVAINFSGSTNMFINKKVRIKKNSTFNPGGDYVQVYVDDKFEVKENSTFYGHVYATRGIHAHGRNYKPVEMTGTFIGKRIHGYKDVTWNWDSNCDPAPVPVLPELCDDCHGGVTYMELAYNGMGPVFVEIAGKHGSPGYFSGIVNHGDVIAVNSTPGNKLDKNTEIHVDNVLHKKVHTSGSLPIGPDLILGDFTVTYTECWSSDHPICPVEDPLAQNDDHDHDHHHHHRDDNDDDRIVALGSIASKAYPNPFTRSVMIEFTLTTEGRTKVQIMNLDGIKVMEKDLGFVDAGSPHQFEFS